MAREREPVQKVQMTGGKRNTIHQLLEEYDIPSAEDIQETLKDLMGGIIKEMMETEMDDHLGYEKSQCSDSDDHRNGKKTNVSTAAMVPWRLKCRKIADLLLILRSFKNVRRTFPPSTAKSYPCMPKE